MRSGVLVPELEGRPLASDLIAQKNDSGQSPPLLDHPDTALLSKASARLGPVATVTSQYHSLKHAPDGCLLAAGTERGWRLLNAPALTWRAAVDGGAVRRVALSPDGARLAAAVSDWRLPGLTHTPAGPPGKGWAGEGGSPP